MFSENNHILKEAGDGYWADAAGDRSENRALRRATRLNVAGERTARFGGAGVNQDNAIFEHFGLDKMR